MYHNAACAAHEMQKAAPRTSYKFTPDLIRCDKVAAEEEKDNVTERTETVCVMQACVIEEQKRVSRHQEGGTRGIDPPWRGGNNSKPSFIVGYTAKNHINGRLNVPQTPELRCYLDQLCSEKNRNLSANPTSPFAT